MCACRLVLALCALLCVLTHRGACQPFYLLRPVPSDSLPVLELQEDPDPELDPADRDLNQTELRSVLGRGFDPNFMSVSPPEDRDRDRDRDREEELQAGHRVSGSLPAELRALELEAALGRGRQRPGRKLRRRLQLWLWSLGLCPVVQAWTDLGRRFWPRYVKLGSCSSRRSCSVPEGMRCAPAKSSSFTLLRWRCVHRRSGPQRCVWIPVQYPVVSECKCACPT